MERLTIDLSKKIDGSCGEVTYHYRKKGMPNYADDKVKFFLIRGETAERTRPTDSLKS